jgi:hypothetical protein
MVLQYGIAVTCWMVLQYGIVVTCWMVLQYAKGITDYTITSVTAVTMPITITVYVLSAFKKPKI